MVLITFNFLFRANMLDSNLEHTDKASSIDLTLQCLKKKFRAHLGFKRKAQMSFPNL